MLYWLKKSLKKAQIFASLHMIVSILTIFFVGAMILCATDAQAASKKKRSAQSQENPKYAALVMDAQTGEILMARHADSQRHPASLTKVMTLYMLFEAIDAGKIRMNDRIPVSAFAAGKPPSKLGLPAGSTIRVEDAVKALVTRSANDIAAALGEKLGGSERNFAAQMTARAKRLGMSRTVYRNASGLPDQQQITTARDQARLAQAMLNDFPHYYHYFGITNFEFQGANYHNHNRLLGNYSGLDGIKTGYVNASGFNLIASAKQNNRRLIGIVMGGRTSHSRNAHMVKLLDEGFSEINKRKTPRLQYASISSAAASAPVPLPPPMVDDIRGVTEFSLADDNSTDGDEGMLIQASLPAPTRPVDRDMADVAYAPVPAMRPYASYNTSQQSPANNNDIVATPLPAPKVAPTPVTTQQNTAVVSAPIPAPLPARRDVAPTSLNKQQQVIAAVDAPIPAQRPPVNAQMAPVGAPAAAIATAPNGQTVMQLRIPRENLPEHMRNASAANSVRSWSIQVGAFHSRAMTDEALRSAQSKLPSHLRHARPVIVPQNMGSKVLFRGRLQGFNEMQANAACAHLGACMVVAPSGS